MKHFTLDQEINRIPEIPDHYGWKNGMKEGAEWQKEQYKELIPLLKKAADLSYNVNEMHLVDQIETVIKRLKD